jgi:hypothetical protein
LRIEYENAFYHVIARGERRDSIFTCDGDKDILQFWREKGRIDLKIFFACGSIKAWK